MKARLLSKLRIEEISGVDKGANAGARVSFWKRDDSKQETKKMDIDQLIEKFEKLEAENAELQKVSKLNDAEKTFMASMDEGQQKRFLDLDEKDRKKETDKSDHKRDLKKAEDEVAAKKLADEEEEAKKVAKAKADEEAKKGDDKVSDISKADFEALQKKNTDLEDTVAKMQADQELQEFTKRAETDLPNLAGSAEDKGKFIKALFDMKEADRDLIMGEMKKADTITSKWFDSIGTSAPGLAGDDPVAKLEALTQKRMATTHEDHAIAYDAITKTDEGKALYEESVN